MTEWVGQQESPRRSFSFSAPLFKPSPEHSMTSVEEVIPSYLAPTSFISLVVALLMSPKGLLFPASHSRQPQASRSSRAFKVCHIKQANSSDRCRQSKEWQVVPSVLLKHTKQWGKLQGKVLCNKRSCFFIVVVQCCAVDILIWQELSKCVKCGVNYRFQKGYKVLTQKCCACRAMFSLEYSLTATSCESEQNISKALKSIRAFYLNRCFFMRFEIWFDRCKITSCYFVVVVILKNWLTDGVT